MPTMKFDQKLRARKDEIGNDYAKAVQVFLADRRRMGCTERTIEWYEDILGRDFIAFLEKYDLPTAPDKWISADIEQYMDYLRTEKNCKPATCKNRFTVLRAFCNFLYKKGYITENPVSGLAPMKVKKETVKTIGEEDLAKILKKPKLSNCTFADIREWAVMWTMFDTGIRLNELVNIQMKDVHLDEGYILIRHGKGQKERPVSISKTLEKVLREYLTIRDPESEEDYLFPNSYGEKISSSTIRKRLYDIGKKAGIKGLNLSPHKFRYTFAKHWIKNGGDPFRLQKALGHTTIEMVRNYVEMFDTDVMEAHRECSPADNYIKRQGEGEEEKREEQRRKRIRVTTSRKKIR